MRKSLIVLFLFFAGFLYAEESREWVVDGQKICGTFDRVLFGEIQLIEDDSGEFRLVSYASLSPQDRYYVQTTIPPEIKITVRKKERILPDPEWSNSGVDEEETRLWSFDVKLLRGSELPNKMKLTAELFVIAEDVEVENNFVLIHRERVGFSFPDRKKASHGFAVNDIPIRTYPAWVWETPKWKRGARYLGYLVVVSDAEKNLIASKTDISLDWVNEDLSKTAECLRRIAFEGHGSIYSRHFNRSLKKIKAPGMKWVKRTRAIP